MVNPALSVAIGDEKLAGVLEGLGLGARGRQGNDGNIRRVVLLRRAVDARLHRAGLGPDLLARQRGLVHDAAGLVAQVQELAVLLWRDVKPMRPAFVLSPPG